MARNDEDPAGLLAELGIDPQAPDVVAAREDAHHYQQLVLELTDARMQAGMSQGDVAKQMRTGQSAVSRLECGLSDARYSTLQRYARALGLRLTVELETSPTAGSDSRWIRVSSRGWAGTPTGQDAVVRLRLTHEHQRA